MVSQIDKFEINNVSSDEYNLYCDTITIPNFVEENTTEIKIPGREETILQHDESYPDIPVTITAYIFDNAYNINPLYAWLRKAEMLTTSLTATYYFKVKKVLGIIPDYCGHQKTRLKITFLCSPFRYDALNTIVTLYENDAVVTNNKNIFARPRFEIHGSGDIELKVNSSSNPLTIYNVVNSAYVDTEKMLVYNIDKELYTTSGNIPMFGVGENYIHWTGNVEYIRIIKNLRWL